MKIIKSRYLGFCSGVKLCVSKVEKILNSGLEKKVFSLGEIIHNEEEMMRLKNLGLNVIKNLDEIPQNEKCFLVIPAYGIEKERFATLKKYNNVDIIDGTCKIVKNLQTIIKTYSEKGYNVIMLGDINHPEVKSSVSYVNPDVKKIVINSYEETDNINFSYDSKIVLVSQTTKEFSIFEKISDILKSKYTGLEVINNIFKETVFRE